jgi:hypothetical protein
MPAFDGPVHPLLVGAHARLWQQTAKALPGCRVLLGVYEVGVVLQVAIFQRVENRQAL